MAPKVIVVLTTTPDRTLAKRIAREFVRLKLAACIQTLGPVSSTYAWKGKIETAKEFLLLIKTTSAHYAQIEKQIRELHPYDTPEILALPAARVEKKYGKWLVEQTKP